MQRLQSLPETSSVDMPAIGKFFREKSISLSTAIAKRILSMKENNESNSKSNSNVTQFNLSGLKVIVKPKNGNENRDLEFKGESTSSRDRTAEIAARFDRSSKNED
ncbi:unnamed protein product [Camellia sinensis]